MKKARDAWQRYTRNVALGRALAPEFRPEADQLVDELKILASRLAASIGPAAAAGALFHYADLISKATSTRGPEKGSYRNHGILMPRILLSLFDQVRPMCRSDNHAFEEIASFIEDRGHAFDANFHMQSRAAVVQAVRRSVKSRARSNELGQKMIEAMPPETLTAIRNARSGRPEGGGLFGLPAPDLKRLLDDEV